MSLDFSVVPSFGDEDMEAPFTATLANRSVNGLRYRWTCENAAIADKSASDSTTLTCSAPGTYVVVLEADNGKEVKSVSKTLVVKPNSNLYSMNDVKLGIRSAHAVVGCFYSCVLRRVVTGNDVDRQNGPLIDFVFFGLDETFGRCRILSPDSAGVNSFYDIPGASRTAVVNRLENSAIRFTTDDFERMTDDGVLKNLPVAENDSGEARFNADLVPRIVLFETADGRKGAIRIREFAAKGRDSYVAVDIKVQKMKN